MHWMNSRVRRQALVWSVPAAYIVSAMVLGRVMPELDKFLWVDTSIFSAGTAVELLSAIASGMLAFTGFVFSMTFLLVQFGSSAYSPRLTQYFIHDSVVRHSLGMFIATFVYSLIALMVVGLPGRSIISDATIFAALLGVLGSIIWFLALIQHITALQVTNVLYMVGDKGRQVIDRLYPEPYSPDHPSHRLPVPVSNRTSAAGREIPDLPTATQQIPFTGRPLAILEVNIERLVALANSVDAVIQVHYWVGDTVPDDAVLLEVHGATKKLNEWRLSETIEMGRQRRIEQDPKYAIRLIVDIALRALSAAINDPTTAVQALDQLDDLMRRIGCRELNIGYAYDGQGKLRVVHPTPTWEDYLDLAFHEIRHFGATSIQVMRRLRALLQDLVNVVPPERRGLVMQHLMRVDAAVDRAFSDLYDQADAHEPDRQGIGLSRKPG